MISLDPNGSCQSMSMNLDSSGVLRIVVAKSMSMITEDQATSSKAQASSSNL